jgi:hypothetical protein
MPVSNYLELEDLIDHLARSSRLAPSEVARLVDDVIAFLNEAPQEFICRRHRELQAEGHANEVIFARVRAEVIRRRFRAPVYSERQVRRIVYG